MSENFIVVVEIDSAQLLTQLQKLENMSSEENYQVGYFNTVTNVLKFVHFPPLNLRLSENRNKKTLLFRATGKSYAVQRTPAILNGELTLCNEQYNFDEDRPKSSKTTKTLKEEINLNKLPKASFSLKENDERGYTLKMDPEELRESLFEMFSERPEMYFDEIQSFLDQPRGYLQGCLDDLCNKRKEKNKFVYSLKDVYLLHKDDDVKKGRKGIKRV